MLNFSEKGSPALLLTARLLTSRHMFPGWEHFIPNVGKIATINASNCYL